MKQMVAFFTLCTALATPAFGADEITVNYQYEGNVRTDFSSMSRGPLKVAEFTDARSGEANVIADGYMTDRALAAIVRDALVQGLEKGKAGLVDDGENMTLAGTLQSAQLQMVDDNGVSSMQLTIRTRVQLQSGGRTIWETVLFGRGTAPETAGMEQALSDALDRTVRGLLQDDYFLIEVL